MTIENDESSEIVTLATNNMPIEMNRRKFMTVATGASTAVLAGCTGSSGGDVVLEYSYEEGDPGQDTIPQDVKDAAGDDVLIRGDEHKWVVFTLEILEGELHIDEIMDHAYIETDVDSHFTRSVVITSPEDAEETIPEGGEADVLYQIPVEDEVTGWTIEQPSLDIEVNEV